VRLRTVPLALLLAAIVALLGAPGAGASNDPGFPQQWNLTQIGAPGAWARSTGSGVKVGIVDTGVDIGHEDLVGKVVESTTCMNGTCSGSGQDDNGHGTHVAGIATANKDNGVGIAGVAPGAQLVVAKVLDNSGSGSPSDVADGIHWVVQHGAQVVNLSLGDSGLLATFLSDQTFLNAIEDAWNAGAIPVLAAGNADGLLGTCPKSYPSNLDALVVGATGPQGEVSFYSCPLSGAKWGLVAPGGDDSVDNCKQGAGGVACVLSTWPGNQYALLQGTSMAAPQVTGAVALLFAQHLSRDAVVQRILGTTAKVSCGTGCQGRLDASAAVGSAPAPQPGGPGSTGSGTPGGTSAGTSAPRSSRAPATTRRPAAATTAPPASTTTAPAGPAVAGTTPGSVPPLVALPASPKGSAKGGAGGSGRTGQVALAIGLLGTAGTGAGLALRWFRAAAAP